MGAGGGSQTTTQTSEPWSEQKPYLEKGFQEAGRVYDQGPQEYFPGDTFVDFSPQTEQALTGMEARANAGSPVTSNASNYAADTLAGNSNNPYAPLLGQGADTLSATARGDFLNNNPYLDKTFDAAAGRVRENFQDSVLPGIAAQFGESAGGALHGEALAKAGGQFTDSLSSLGADIYGGDYARERDRMLNAGGQLTSTGANLYNTGVNERLNTLGMSPNIAAAEYADLDRLAGVGQTREGLSERKLEDQINRFNFDQTKELSSLQDYMALISGNYGGTSVSRGSKSGSPLTTGAGAALSILSQF